MRRRRVLVGLGAGLAAGVAGCSGVSGTAPETPPSGTDPVTLLPPTPDDMTEVRRTELPPGDTGAEAGAVAEFRADPGVRYYVEVLRWPDDAAADDGVSVYTGSDTPWLVYVTNGPFSWAGAAIEGTEETLLDVLGAAEGLSRDYAERMDAIDG